MPTPLASAFIRIRPQSDDFQRDTEREFGRAGQRAGQRFSESFRDQVGRSSRDSEEAGEQAGRRFGGAFEIAVGSALGDQISNLAGKAAETLSAGFEQALDLTGARGMLQAQLGLTQQESARIGGVAGKLFSQAYGENMQEVQGAVTSVIQNMDGMRNAGSGALEQMTARAITTGQVLGEDVGAVTQGVSQIMRTGLAPNAEAAFDIITRGAQLGLNSSEDLLDTFKEYGTQFRKLGLDGKTALGLIQQGLKGGARDADLVADALKEFSIRAVDGSTLSAQGFKDLGLNADKMAKQISKGGSSASAGLDTVLDRLRRVKDPVKQSQIAVALFGTQAEDLGKALFKLDPSQATKGLGDLAGATDKASKAIGDTPQSKFEAFKRGMQTNIVTFIANEVIPAVQKIGGAFDQVGVSGSGLASVAVPMVGLGLGAKVAASAVSAVSTGVTGVVKAGKGIGAAAQGVGRLSAGFRSAQVAESAFSGRMGTLGGKLRTAFSAGVSGASRFASATASAGAAAGRGLATAATAAGRAAVSAATATASFAAMGARMLWAGTQAVFFAAKSAIASAATKIWSAVQLAFNLIMSANPITLVIIGLVALGAAVVLAYQKFGWFRNAVNAVFNFLKTGVMFVVNFVKNNWRLLLPILLGPFGIAIALITKYWSQIKNATVGAIRTAVNFVRNNWRLIISILLGPLGIAISLVTKYWGTIKNRTTTAVSSAVNFVRSHWRQIIAFISSPITVAIGYVTRGWNKIKSLTNSLSSAVTGKIRSMMSGARNAFSSGVSAIGSAWNRLRDATKRPVNFVIGTVYNKGIVGLWNKVMGWLHLPGSLRLGKLPLMESGGPMPVKPGVFNKPTAVIGEGNPKYPEYVIPTDPKYRTRAMALWSAAGHQMQMMQIGGIIGSVKKIAGKVGNIGKTALNLITNPGKVWDDLVKSHIPSFDLGGGPWNTGIEAIPKMILGKARGYALSLFKAFNAGFGGNSTAVVKAALRHVGQGDDRGPNNNQWTRKWGMVGAPWCAIFVSEMIKEAKAGKKYPGSPSAAVASFNAGMRHVSTGSGKAGDLATYRGNGHINIIEKPAGNGAYWTIGGNQNAKVQHGVRSGMTAILRPMAAGGLLGPAMFRRIFRHEAFHTADAHEPSPFMTALGKLPLRTGMETLRQAGTLGLNMKPRFDDGGFGVGWPFHKKKPEAVFTNSQWNDIHELAKRGARGDVTVNMNGLPNIPSDKQVANAIDNVFTLHGRW